MQNNNRYCQKTFENIPADKQKKVIDTAKNHFARYGFDGTNTNKVAQDAGISVGSLYKYFATKEDLFLRVVHEGSLLLEQALSKIGEPGDILEFFEGVLRAARDFALEYPEYNRIYLDLTTRSQTHMSEKVCNKIEDITAKKYKELMERSKERGVIRQDVSVNEAAFCLDNLVIMLQFSFASPYYKERMRTFLGQDEDLRGDRVIKRLVDFAGKGLRAEEKR